MPLREWVDTLRNLSDPSPRDTADMHALKMLEFYEILGNGTECLKYEKLTILKRYSGQRSPLRGRRGVTGLWVERLRKSDLLKFSQILTRCSVDGRYKRLNGLDGIP